MLCHFLTYWSNASIKAMNVFAQAMAAGLLTTQSVTADKNDRIQVCF